MLASQETPLAPHGLKFSEPTGFRFWIRPDSARFDGLFAVSVRDQQDGINVCVFPIVGHIGDFAFDWSNPQHAMSLVASIVPGSHSLRLFADLAPSFGTDWLLCNADDENAALSCEDAVFLRKWVISQGRFRGMQGVYFASNGRGRVKIGKSDRCLLTRLRGLQISSPDELYIVAVVPTPNASEVEELLHKKHNATRIRGEWFAMTDAQAIASAKEFGGNSFGGFLS